jgi:anti-anti-sigma regulatory factor
LLGAVGRADQVEIDLGGVERIDTAVVQLLLLAKREMGAKAGRLLLVNHSAPVVEALDLYGLSAHFGDPVLLRDAAGG